MADHVEFAGFVLSKTDDKTGRVKKNRLLASVPLNYFAGAIIAVNIVARGECTQGASIDETAGYRAPRISAASTAVNKNGSNIVWRKGAAVEVRTGVSLIDPPAVIAAICDDIDLFPRILADVGGPKLV